MKHDITTRRVLRTKRQFLEKFHLWSVAIVTVGVIKIVIDERQGKKDSFISSRIKKLSKEELKEDACKIY
jgi:hypothetical protein